MERKSKKTISKYWYVLIGLFIIILLIMVPLILSMNGETKTTGEWSEETSESLSCKARNINYEFFGEDQAVSSNNVQIHALFNNNKLNSINLVRKMTYADKETAKTWSDAHEFNVNKDFGDKGMKPYSLNANFSTDDNVAQMSLYATSSEINSTSIRYFMLDSVPKDIDGYKKDYTARGFSCEIVKGNNQ